MVGSLRKRVLLLWQAVEFSRSSERPNLATLQVASHPLEVRDSCAADISLSIISQRHEGQSCPADSAQGAGAA